MLWDIYPKAREVFLVRDFRDMISSILTFNKKRGYAAFGRDEVTSDEAYVKRMRFSALRLLRNWKNRANKAFLLRYEDLFNDTDTTLGSLLDYLSLDSDARTRQRMLLSAKEFKPTIQKSHQTSESPDVRLTLKISEIFSNQASHNI